jgi:hypothetical protein
MDSNKCDEITYRRRALRLARKGKRPCEILRRIPRCREWLRKWGLRYAHEGWAGLASGSPRPHHSPHEYSREARAGVAKLRRNLTRSGVGCVGARAVRQEMLRARLRREGPSTPTIKRWVTEAGLIKKVSPPPEKGYYPQPRLTQDRVLHVMDWIARYLEGGEKLCAFHTVEWQTRALTQTLKANKTVARVTAHVLETWQERGLPDFLQLDHDAAFTGGSNPGECSGLESRQRREAVIH